MMRRSAPSGKQNIKHFDASLHFGAFYLRFWLRLEVILVKRFLKQSLLLQVCWSCQTDPLQRCYQWGPQQPAGAWAQRGSGSPQRPAVCAGSGRHNREWVFTPGNASLSDWGRIYGHTQSVPFIFWLCIWGWHWSVGVSHTHSFSPLSYQHIPSPAQSSLVWNVCMQ